MTNETVQTLLPLLPLRELCLFPGATLHFDIGRQRSISALEAAMKEDRRILLITQKDASIDHPKDQDLYPVGTVALIKQVLKMPGNIMRVLAEGQFRAQLTKVFPTPKYDKAQYEPLIAADSADTLKQEAFLRLIQEELAKFARASGKVMPKVDNLPPALACDLLAAGMPISMAKKQQVLACAQIMERLELLYTIIVHEAEVAKAEADIQQQVKANIEKAQREVYLREQMRVIQKELHEGAAQKADELARRVEDSDMSDDAKKNAREELARMQISGPHSPDYAVSFNYVSCLLDLPWKKAVTDNASAHHARKILDQDHYGMDTIKDRIVEFLSVKALTGSMKGPILCFAGPPGVGKTSIARSIARALGRPFFSMSLGGMRDEAEIRGHRRTYIGANPGRIVTMMKQAGVVNPVILFDEIDKLTGGGPQGDPASAMLEVLDPEQNHAFRDHYLDTPYDLSKVLFLTTANNIDTIPRPLLDRMEIIQLDSYTDLEKLKIAQKYLVPKQVKENGLKGRIPISITPTALSDIINLYTHEAGVRALEREIGKICRKVACSLTDETAQLPKKVSITKPALLGYLGAPRYLPDDTTLTPKVGVVTGLAWTAVGGVTLCIEVSAMPGKGEVRLTGNLGDVMKESAQAAISYLRANAQRYGLKEDFAQTTDLHIHLPEAATPKDGPSAGITLTLAILSALLNRPVRGDIAMTGEITLRGRVLPIGGLKEKVMAAYRAGIRTVLYPAGNLKDTTDIAEQVRSRVMMSPVSTMEQVIDLALLPAQEDTCK